MRNGFNGLAAKVQTMLKDDPMSGHVFIFRAAAAGSNCCGPPATCLLTKRRTRPLARPLPAMAKCSDPGAAGNASGRHRLAAA
ncbi:hypothetical protein EAN89_26665 [Klebsiella pneumoniae]|nr:hypothetical protein EAN89_26665 [Klebsiella pneumoniae]